MIHDSRGIIHTIKMWQVPFRFNNTDGLDFADVKHLDSYLMTDFDRIHPFEFLTFFASAQRDPPHKLAEGKG